MNKDKLKKEFEALESEYIFEKEQMKEKEEAKLKKILCELPDSAHQVRFLVYYVT